MERRGLVYFIQDISRSIAAVERFVANVDFESFVTNEEKASAVMKKLEIIGEAVKQIPEEIRIQYPEIPWRAIDRCHSWISSILKKSKSFGAISLGARHSNYRGDFNARSLSR